MANKLSYRDIWVSKVSERLQARDGYAGIVKQIESTGGRHVLWEKLHNPSSPIETDLSFAINIGCVFPTNPYVSIFLGWAKESAGMALNDVRFYIDPDEQRGLIGWKVKGVYPGTHGKTLAAACIVNAMHHDNELDAVLVMRACGEIAESALVGGSSTWDYIAQSEYLRCVRLALICGELDKAQYFLKNIRRKFKNTFLHHELLEHITNTLTSSSEKRDESLTAFQDYFDLVRNPNYQLPTNEMGGGNLAASLPLLRLELAIIKQRYVLNSSLAGHWQEVMALIAE